MKPPSSYSMIWNSQLLLQKTAIKVLPTLGDRSLGCAAPNLWNGLPSRIQQADSIGSFKKLLKTHLSRKAYYNIYQQNTVILSIIAFTKLIVCIVYINYE